MSTSDILISNLGFLGFVSHFSLVAVAVIASAVTLLLHVALFVGFKHLKKKNTPVTVNEGKRKVFFQFPCLHLPSVSLRSILIFLHMFAKLVCKTCTVYLTCLLTVLQSIGYCRCLDI